MTCGKNCGDNCGCCFEDGVATTTHQVGDCTVFDVVISSDPCNTVSLGSDGGLLVKECAGVFEDSLCDDATDPPTPFVRTTIIACDGTRTVTDTTPDGDPYTVVGNVVCCGGGGGAVPDVVTTLVEDAVAKTATYTNEIGATTVLSETDFTANSQIIPATCEGVLDDADVLRELPVRWDTASNTYKVYDDGKTTQVMAIQNGSGTSQIGLVPTGNTQLSTISSLIINNPSTCKPLQIMVAPWIQGDVTNGSGSNWFYADHLLYYGFNVPPILDSRVATTVGTFTPIGGAIEKKQSVTDRRFHLETIPAGGSGTINYRCGHEIKQGSNIASVVTISSVAVWGVIA